MNTRGLALPAALAVVLLPLCPASPSGQHAQGALPALSAPIKPDPSVRQGRLANSLTFIIKRNQSPASRVAIRLVLKAGTLDEDDDQNGVAHFIEHMAFNGTAHFARTDMVEFFKSIGARLGPDLSGSTMSR